MAGHQVPVAETPPAVSVCLEVLKKRGDFVAASKAKRHGTPGIHLQGRNRADEGGVRVGFTCSKKVGNAVARNRAKRRLRALAAEILPEHALVGWDYVLIGRPEHTARWPFDQMRRELIKALEKVHPQ